MGKLVVHENVTIDGVVQDPSGEEGFAFGGWFDRMPADDREQWAKVEYEEALNTDAWLLGRGSFAYFAERWADRPGEWADRLRSIPKYVVSSTLSDAGQWSNSIVLGGDVIDEVSLVKQHVEGEIVVYGSRPLVQTLLAHDLVDEVRLMTHPFVLGSGERLFGALDEMKPMSLADVRAVGNTLALLTYRVARHA